MPKMRDGGGIGGQVLGAVKYSNQLRDLFAILAHSPIIPMNLGFSAFLR